MSHTIKPHSCSTIREMVYNYRRGELSELDAALFEDTIAACPACGRYASRLIDMLDVVDEADAQDYLGKPLDEPFADDLFASILSGIEQDISPLDAQDDDEQDTVSQDFAELDQLEASLDRQHTPEGVVRLDDYLRHGKRAEHDDEPMVYPHYSSARSYILLAAMMLGVVGGAYLAYSALASPEVDTPDMQAQEQLVRQARKIKHLKSFESLSQQASTPDAIKVFANKDAQWHIEGDSPHYTLHLEQGTVLVEFLPTKKESLRVLTQETQVDVVGTVFYVSAEEESDEGDEIARVGVLTGKVRVKPSPEQEVVELEDGQQLEEDASVTTIEAETFERSSSLIDLDAHRAVLASRAKSRAIARNDSDTRRATEEAPLREEILSPRPPLAQDKVNEQPAKASPSALPPAKISRREALQTTAQKAMRDKDYTAAAQAIEELLDTLPEGHIERATFRLELARIYMRHIGKRGAAVRHLRLFVAQHPNDVAAPSARRQLCRLLGPESSTEPACLSLTTP